MKAILFDMDGVLIDSEALMAKSGILALRDYGLDPKPEDFIPFVGQGEDKYIGGVARKYGLTYNPAMKSLAYHYYGQYVEAEASVPGDVHWVLTSIKEKGYKIAVCTSADYAKVVHNLRAIGLSEDFFDAFVTGDKIQNLKP
ncbi:MAG: HAD hydrolase-like protein, partial [Clostridia bacterium]|nr:HAD hydrolase-like protein [Clostridia bacterium]